MSAATALTISSVKPHEESIADDDDDLEYLQPIELKARTLLVRQGTTPTS